MIFGGVFERYPKLRVGAVEFEVSWAPYFLSRMDNLNVARTAHRNPPEAHAIRLLRHQVLARAWRSASL